MQQKPRPTASGRRRRPGRLRRLLALGSAGALSLAVLSACGDDDSDEADGVTEISIATFNEFGYEELIEEWNADHPDIHRISRWSSAQV